MKAPTEITGKTAAESGFKQARPTYPGVCAAAREAMGKSALGKSFLAAQGGNKPVLGTTRRGYPSL